MSSNTTIAAIRRQNNTNPNPIRSNTTIITMIAIIILIMFVALQWVFFNLDERALDLGWSAVVFAFLKQQLFPVAWVCCIRWRKYIHTLPPPPHSYVYFHISFCIIVIITVIVIIDAVITITVSNITIYVITTTTTIIIFIIIVIIN